MTSSENTAAGIRPRPVVDLLPRYAAGKPPVPVEGLVSYKLSSNENPLPPIPAVQQAIAAQTDFNRYPDPLSSKLRGVLSGFLDVPAEDIVTGGGSLGENHHDCHHGGRMINLMEVPCSFHTPSLFEAFTLKVYSPGSRLV